MYYVTVAGLGGEPDYEQRFTATAKDMELEVVTQAPEKGELRAVATTRVWRFKDDVTEVEEGQECGIVLDGFADIKEGDVLEFFETKQVEKTLES